MAAVASVPYSPSIMHASQEQKSCGGCHNSVEVDTGGVVVAFGNSLWHVDCFKCAKCGDRVSADTNLLLLSDGSPVCASCTYNCAVCRQPISDEAIMTGDESYHAACFTCKTCGRHIGELVFAKTTQGIYCMACHNERVARSRRHAEQRRNRSKPRRDGHREKERLQETPPHLQLKDPSTTSIDMQSPPNTPGFQGLDILHPDAAVSYATKRLSTQSISATLQNSFHPAKSLQQELLPPVPTSPASVQPQLSAMAATERVPPEFPQSTGSRPNPTSTALGDVLQLPGESEYPGIHRSLDDGARPLNNLLSPEAARSQSRPSSSAGRTVRADKRSSINPATRLEWLGGQASSDSQLHTLPSTSDVPNNQQPQQSHSKLRDSDEFPAWQPSRSQRRGSTRSPVDSLYSPPTSPSVSTTPAFQPPAENANVQITQSTATKNYTLQDPPLLPYKPSRQTSPVQSFHNLGVNGVTILPQAENISRELPKLPVDVDPETDGRDSQDDEAEDAHQTVPVTLPPISFSATDTNFNDLFKLGIAESPRHPADAIENSKDDSRPHTSNEDFEAGLSKLVPPNAGASPPTVSPSSSPNAKLMLHQLTNPPKRSASLARKMNSRKPVPKAIILSDNFDADTTLDLDGSFNDPSSPGRVEFYRKLSDPVATPTRRPASAGSGASPSHVPQTSTRRSSDHVQSGGSPLASLAPPTWSHSKPTVTIVDPNPKPTLRPVASKHSSTELITRRIKEALTDAQESGASTVRLDREFLEIIYSVVQTNHEKLHELQGRFDRMRRTSQQVMDGLSVAQEEYDKELAARRDAEAEVTRLKVQLSGQAARLTQLSAEDRKREIGEQMSRDLSANLDGLERDLSRIMAARDLAVAEVEELTASKTAATHGDGGLQRSLTHRFDNLKNQYKRELEPLLRQRETLLREINELKEERNICLEEATALNARNEELAQLNAQTTRHIESAGHTGAMRAWTSMPSTTGSQQPQQVPSTPKMVSMFPAAAGYSQDERDEPRLMSNEKKSKWFKPSREPMRPLNDAHPPLLEPLRHNFQQLTVLRVARCDHCGDKMWGTQLRCNLCNFGCHNRCVSQVTSICSGDVRLRDDGSNGALLQPSMFGRDLIELVRAESVREHRDVPIIVEKCIEAVERLAMDYEGIYRKTGGSAQSKAIIQLFERGNYETIDLCDAETFNDISSVTSALKTYFRQLPNPLLTHALHEAFISGAIIRDPRGKAESLTTLVFQLPSEHFHTLRYLMLHLHRIQARSAENFMTARNLGVVFGPTLMRASDLSREYSDMAGKALAIEWLVENSPTVFREES